MEQEQEKLVEVREEYPALCPQCDNPSLPLGQLGNLEWHRCRGCGIDFATVIVPVRR